MIGLGVSPKGQTRREAGTQSYGLFSGPRGDRSRLPGYRRDGRDPYVDLVDRAAARPPGFFCAPLRAAEPVADKGPVRRGISLDLVRH